MKRDTLKFPEIRNRAMARKLARRKCLDIARVGILVEGTAEKPVLFELEKVIDGKDYAHVPTESWVWSIGKSKATGRILASFDARFYQNPNYECLWLR